MIIFIGLGGVLGAAARYGIGRWVTSRSRSRFPWATFLINCLGSLVIGILFSSYLHGTIPQWLWQFAGAGLCGGFTTFSTFGYETIELIREGKSAQAVVYATGSWLLGLLLAWFGMSLI